MESLPYILLAAFAGGLILNVMPCVLPVLTMKVFHLIEHAHDERRRRLHGLAYTGGVLLAFAAFAAGVVLLRLSGEVVGWGIQFQNPAFVAVITTVIFLLALNALGVFEIRIGMRRDGDGSGLGGSFANGVVASVMSTPCSAPFLGSAAAFALAAQTAPALTFGIFLMIGLGLSTPFLLVTFIPPLARTIPRPGPWMETFKHLMGFTLMAAAIWLYSVLQRQIALDDSRWFLGLLLVLAVAVWAMERFAGPLVSALRRWTIRAVVGAAVVAFAFSFVRLDPATQAIVSNVGGETVVDGEIRWVQFKPETVAAMRLANRPVFIDFTADWCANCKANERLFIEVQSFRDALVETGVLPMKADLTHSDDTIWEWLDDLGRASIPTYAIYLPDGSVDLLPETINTGLLVSRLEAAASRFPKSEFEPIPSLVEPAEEHGPTGAIRRGSTARR